MLFCTQSLAQFLTHTLLFHKYTEIKAIKHKLPNLFFLYQNIHLVILFGSPCLRRSLPLPRLIPTIVFFDVMILTPYGFFSVLIFYFINPGPTSQL